MLLKHFKHFTLAGIVVLSMSIVQAIPDYPLLKEFVNRVDKCGIVTSNTQNIICIDSNLNINVGPQTSVTTSIAVSSIAKPSCCVISVNYPLEHRSYFGTLDKLCHLILDKDIEKNRLNLLWDNDNYGIYCSIPVINKDLISQYNTFYVSAKGTIERDYLGLNHRIHTDIYDQNNWIAIQDGKEIGRVPKPQKCENDRAILCDGRSNWKHSENSLGLCFYYSKQHPDTFMTSVEFDIPQIYYGIINNNTSVIHQLPTISINSLNDIIGGSFGGQNPDKIFSCPYPAFNLEKRVAYIPIHYSYRVADETIYISACFRLKENKPLELADCQIRYRNDSNRLLNMDWCRGSSGKFILAAAIDNEPPFYEFDVTNHDELCTVNGGRLWLLKFD